MGLREASQSENQARISKIAALRIDYNFLLILVPFDDSDSDTITLSLLQQRLPSRLSLLLVNESPVEISRLVLDLITAKEAKNHKSKEEDQEKEYFTKTGCLVPNHLPPGLLCKIFGLVPAESLELIEGGAIIFFFSLVFLFSCSHDSVVFGSLSQVSQCTAQELYQNSSLLSWEAATVIANFFEADELLYQ